MSDSSIWERFKQAMVQDVYESRLPLPIAWAWVVLLNLSVISLVIVFLPVLIVFLLIHKWKNRRK